MLANALSDHSNPFKERPYLLQIAKTKSLLKHAFSAARVNAFYLLFCDEQAKTIHMVEGQEAKIFNLRQFANRAFLVLHILL
jgi:hypothetical protein